MKKKIKDPWVAAILNFFFPGLGFIYLGRAEFIVGGLMLFIVDLMGSCAILVASINPISLAIVWTVVFSLSFLWAVLGYISAEYVNKHYD